MPGRGRSYQEVFHHEIKMISQNSFVHCVFVACVLKFPDVFAKTGACSINMVTRPDLVKYSPNILGVTG